MKADQARLRELLTQSITLMCKSGLDFHRDLHIEGLLAITVDGADVFVVHMDEKIARPLLAEGNRCTDTITGHHSLNSASGFADAGPENVGDNAALPPASSSIDYVNEMSSRECIEYTQSIKTESDCDEGCENDVIIIESDVKSVICSSVPLPALERLNEHDCSLDGMQLSPTSRKKRKLDTRESGSDMSVPLPVASASRSESIDKSPVIPLVVEDDRSDDPFNWSFSDAYSIDSTRHNAPSFSWNDIYNSGANGMNSQTALLPSVLSQSLAAGNIVPMNTLTSRVIRDALVKCIVDPLVFKSGRNVVAFRVIWRHYSPLELDNMWLTIDQHRQTCDDAVRRQPNVDFFFSCISGLYNKNCPRHMARAIGIIPSISYYVVGGMACESLMSSIQCSIVGADLKLITARLSNSATADSLFYLSSPLYIVLKDHNSKCIKEQLIRSDMLDKTVPVVKLVAVNCNLTKLVSTACDELKVAAPGLNIHLELPVLHDKP